ncbi:class I SAM-dependent methyltransferase [Phenylobacterium ferrooxidans]|uniref:Class I SAM-dependent methyltransferase n=1 Tax=Phenylobacterium ferrooxidans TaxID=2982689 RepID=A0ABW6CW75_9CAUL
MTPQEFLSQLTLNIERFEKVAAFLSVPGYLSWHEGFTLLSLAEVWPVEGDIVEIGSFKGKSTCFLAQGALRSGRGKVHAVDHFRGSPEHQKGGHEETAEIVESGSTYEQFRANLAAFGLSEVVEAIVSGSQEAAAAWSGSARMVFIDGDHSCQGTKGDFEAWFPHVTETGLICFHDYQNSHYLDGVTRFIEEEVNVHPNMRFLHRANSLMTYMKVA